MLTAFELATNDSILLPYRGTYWLGTHDWNWMRSFGDMRSAQMRVGLVLL